MDISLFKKLKFSDKYAKVYLALLRLGPSSVRTLAASSGLNRGTTYDALKWLKDKGLVDYYKKDSKQHFVAEHPDRLHRLVAEQQEELLEVDRALDKTVAELLAQYHADGERPVARYYDTKELHLILEDVLETCEQSEDALYRIYSAEDLRKYLYEDFSTFSDVRIAKGIAVRVISLGGGGELRGLDERRWLPSRSETPTYIMMYPGKTAYISLDAKGEAIGVVIENKGVYETQTAIFDSLWESLSESGIS